LQQLGRLHLVTLGPYFPLFGRRISDRDSGRSGLIVEG
jgi:hypothetical protein